MDDHDEPQQFKSVAELTAAEHHERIQIGKLPETPEWIEAHADDQPPAIEDMTVDDHFTRIRSQR